VRNRRQPTEVVWHRVNNVCVLVCSEMNRGVEETKQHYQRMMFKEALRTGFFEFQVTVSLQLSFTVCASRQLYLKVWIWWFEAVTARHAGGFDMPCSTSNDSINVFWIVRDKCSFCVFSEPHVPIGPSWSPTFENLCCRADDDLFIKTSTFSNHILHAFLPPRSTTSQRYSLRQRTHLSAPWTLHPSFWL